jgi:2-isopropylmalate synthase
MSVERKARNRDVEAYSEARRSERTVNELATVRYWNAVALAIVQKISKSTFATKAGIHASALAKDPRTYEHVTPESVGNKRAIAVSDQAGRSNLLSELSRLGIEADPNDPRLTRLLRIVKEREAQGYAYEAADASFELLARDALEGVPQFFDVEGFHVGVERKIVAPGVTYSASQAVVKIRIGEDRLISVSEGNGPVNALDLALRKDLGVYQKHIENLKLRDYGVCVFQGGADGATRVLIEFADGAGETWSTVGVSGNIIDASLQALVDAIVYRLVKLGVPAQ